MTTKFKISQVTELAIHLFMRSSWSHQDSGQSRDISLGVVRLPLSESGTRQLQVGAKLTSPNHITHALAEKDVLARIVHPFIVSLKFSFQSESKLYFILAFVNGGNLFEHLAKAERFDAIRARFYTAELICALECLHGWNVIYRDLKPENVLLDYEGHVALCDFGLCKQDIKDGDRTNTVCGTLGYMAPEVLVGSPYTKAVDWWFLGVLLYEIPGPVGYVPSYYEQATADTGKFVPQKTPCLQL
ncbi:unnamed protein product [Penicillium glandicola]